MRTFHRVDQRRAKPAPSTPTQERLPIGQSMAIIGGLSVISWGVVILLAVTIRAAL